jgi:hypothetical protein
MISTDFVWARTTPISLFEGKARENVLTALYYNISSNTDSYEYRDLSLYTRNKRLEFYTRFTIFASLYENVWSEKRTDVLLVSGRQQEYIYAHDRFPAFPINNEPDLLLP